MKRTDTSAPYLSWSIIARGKTDADAAMLEQCLASVRERTPQAEIVIVDTCSPHEGYIAVAKRYADVWQQYTGPNGDWNTEMLAFDDAAAARNEAFHLARGKWRGWIDTDDVLPGPEETERLLKLNARWRPPGVEATKVAAADNAPVPTLEDNLRYVEQNLPNQFVSCPYLYASDDQGLASMWQDRERFVRWLDDNGRQQFIWREPAHEVLVPLDPDKALTMVPAHFPQLLFKHLKKGTAEEMMYSAQRHYRIMRKHFDAGRRTVRDLLYMANLCRPIEPAMEETFLRLAHQHAVTDKDRARALLELGNLASSRGLRSDAREAFGAAVQFRGDLPDAWLAGAAAAVEARDWTTAAQWYACAMQRSVTSESQLNPREHALGTPTRYSRVLVEIAKAQIAGGAHEAALASLDQAEALARQVTDHPAAGPDAPEAQAYWVDTAAKRDAHRAAVELKRTADLLIRSDEPLKAVALIDAFPHTAEDHPLRVALEKWAKKVKLHVTDPVAYGAFYAGLTENECADLGSFTHTVEGALPRTRALIAWLKEQTAAGRRPRVLEVGCYDGNVGVPVLQACPEVTYTAVDASKLALDRFRGYYEKVVPQAEQTPGRLTLINKSFDAAAGVPVEGEFDAVVLYEVIEHVPDPVPVIRSLLGKLKDFSSRLFLSTPCGAFDKGQPHNIDTRDPRGHVRAMTLRDLADAVRAAGAEVEYMENAPGVYGLIGNTTQARVRLRSNMMLATKVPSEPLSFVVPSALWDWNASHVERTGIGASEETIVYLAAELAKDVRRRVEVFGPVPEAEVNKGVAYWPREQARKISGGPIIVSRSPSYFHVLEQANEEHKNAPMALWLQDAWYPDLSPATAARYSKIVVLTEWHKQAMIERCGIDGENIVVIPNFLLTEHFQFHQRIERKPHRFIYSSSPDRGLIPLLKLWPHVLKLWPDAELHIFYGWEGCKRLSSNPAWNERYTAIRADFDQLRWQQGVFDHGRVNHFQIALAMRASDLWAYPTDFEETFCSNAVKARAAGCVPVCPPLAALTHTANCDEGHWIKPWFRGAEHDQGYVDAFLLACEAASATSVEAREKMSREAVAGYDLRAGGILDQWTALIKDLA